MKVENRDLSPTNKTILCNKCEQPCSPNNLLSLDEGNNYGLINASFTSGFDSVPEFEDLNRFTFSMCEVCLVKLFSSFRIKPKQHRIIFINEIVNDEINFIETEDTPENFERQKQFAKRYEP